MYVVFILKSEEYSDETDTDDMLETLHSLIVERGSRIYRTFLWIYVCSYEKCK